MGKWIIIIVWRMSVASLLAIALSGTYGSDMPTGIFILCLFAGMITAFECAATEDGE